MAAFAGNVALTGVTSVAMVGPVEASATNPAGTFVNAPLVPIRYCSATGEITSFTDASTSRKLYET